MESKFVIIGIYALIAVYAVYHIFLKKNLHKEQYEKMYNEVLNSKKYKVKGQFDKED